MHYEKSVCGYISITCVVLSDVIIPHLMLPILVPGTGAALCFSPAMARPPTECFRTPPSAGLIGAKDEKDSSLSLYSGPWVKNTSDTSLNFDFGDSLRSWFQDLAKSWQTLRLSQEWWVDIWGFQNISAISYLQFLKTVSKG